VLPEEVYYAYDAAIVSQGFSVPADPPSQEYHSRVYRMSVDCRETGPVVDSRVAVTCLGTPYGDFPPHLGSSSTTHTWDLLAGQMVGSTGWIDRAVPTGETSVLRVLGRDIPVINSEGYWEEISTTSAGRPQRDSIACTYLRHPNNRLPLWYACNVYTYVLFDSTEYHVADSYHEYTLVDTNLDL
jgi:hypothetical protein